MRCILDTSAWYSFLFETDKNHQKADAIISHQPHLVIPFAVLEELLALIHARKSKKSCLTYINPLLSFKQNKIVPLTKKDIAQIWILYQNSPNYLDYVDCSVIYYSQKFKLPIFGFDKHFKKMKADLVHI